MLYELVVFRPIHLFYTFVELVSHGAPLIVVSIVGGLRPRDIYIPNWSRRITAINHVVTPEWHRLLVLISIIRLVTQVPIEILVLVASSRTHGLWYGLVSTVIAMTSGGFPTVPTITHLYTFNLII